MTEEFYVYQILNDDKIKYLKYSEWSGEIKKEVSDNSVMYLDPKDNEEVFIFTNEDLAFYFYETSHFIDD